MNSVNICASRNYTGAIAGFSSQLNNEHTVENILRGRGFWCTEKTASSRIEYFIVDYKEPVPINSFTITASPSGRTAFPGDFRVEGSLDGETWMILHTEKKFDLEEMSQYTFDVPLTYARFTRFVILSLKQTGARYFAEIGGFLASIRGIRSVSASSNSSHAYRAEKLFDARKESYWESELKKNPSREFIELDLGAVYTIGEITLQAIAKDIHGFPENFFFQTSVDRNVWTPLFEEKYFVAARGSRYSWKVAPTPARYGRLEMNSIPLEDNCYGIRLSCMELSAAPFSFDHTHAIGELNPQASIFQAGIVRLARDGEDTHGTAVQGSDRRLREATTIFKGIVQLSEDGESKPGLAVQASDSRLKPAGEQKFGIVRLAYDRENAANAVVQGNDSRLQEATDSNYGIVKFCPDGVYSDASVIRGSDSRLRRATVESFGICRLANNGENNAECVVQGNDRRLREGTTIYKGIVELAEDGETNAGVAVQGNDRRLKDATTSSKGIIELAEDGEDKPGVAVQGNDRRLKDATTSAKGIVELAEDGENKPGVAVQGNDKRLKDATESTTGILRFAKDGETAAFAAVQGNDKRLKDATTSAKGIVELAEDGENKPGVAVQGNDKRLKDATTSSKGIVELAEDGETNPGVAVQGNDKRLKNATTSVKGIVKLAKDGEDKPGVTVQGNDKRLKDATESTTGILRFAKDGETAAFAAVQGNDKRLKDATTLTKGIIELAEDGETNPGVAVQGNDRRLRDATESEPGIVRLAKNGESKPGTAVQSNDSRLSDARQPLAHTHAYAPLVHDYSSHTGTIDIRESMQQKFSGIVPPPDGSSVLYGKNMSTEDGAVGITGVANESSGKPAHSYGVVGHGGLVGVRGQSTGKSGMAPAGCGVMGISRFGAGGFFASEHSFSLVVDGYGSITDCDDSLNLTGNGDALRVEGKSIFNGSIMLGNRDRDDKSPSNVVEMFQVDDEDYISPGDLLVISHKGGSILSRSSGSYAKSIIGVVSGNPALVFDNSGNAKKTYPVTLAGKTYCKVDARRRPVNPGDLIVSSDMPGAGMAGEIDSFDKIGTVIGKALDRLADGIGIIPIYIVHL